MPGFSFLTGRVFFSRMRNINCVKVDFTIIFQGDIPIVINNDAPLQKCSGLQGRSYQELFFVRTGMRTVIIIPLFFYTLKAVIKDFGQAVKIKFSREIL